MGIFSLPGTKGAAEYAVNKSAKALAKAEEGAQGVGDFFGNVSSHMFGGAMMGGIGNTALYANAGDGYNGVQGYGQAFFSGATAGAIAGGALGAYRGVGRATASDARIARLQAKHEKNQAVLARRSGGGGSKGRGVSPLMKQFNDPTMKARDLIRGDRDAARGGSKKTSTSTPAMNPISTAQAPTPVAAAATPTPTPSQAASTATAGTTTAAATRPFPHLDGRYPEPAKYQQVPGRMGTTSSVGSPRNLPIKDVRGSMVPIVGGRAGANDGGTVRQQKLRDLFAQGKLEAEFEGLM